MTTKKKYPIYLKSNDYYHKIISESAAVYVFKDKEQVLIGTLNNESVISSIECESYQTIKAKYDKLFAKVMKIINDKNQKAWLQKKYGVEATIILGGKQNPLSQVNEKVSSILSSFGKCVEKNCLNDATKDYNGHGHYVCGSHFETLSNYFDDEYN